MEDENTGKKLKRKEKASMYERERLGTGCQ
jgi:hypothetical protein